MKEGRKDRTDRLLEQRSGPWGSSSQSYIGHATDLFVQSAERARASDGNCSAYALSGVPVLLSALRAVLIEANSGLYGRGRDAQLLERLGGNIPEGVMVCEKYQFSPEDRNKLPLLYEVRNEIIHPTHRPAGTSHNTPLGMLCIRELGLLQSTGKEDSDYIWIEQLQSHRLFRWAFLIIENVVAVVLQQHHSLEEDFSFHMQSYKRYRELDIHSRSSIIREVCDGADQV